jgi:hypothetical protein
LLVARSIRALALALPVVGIMAIVDVAGSATSAHIQLNKGCYLLGETASVNGSGFTPGGTWHIALDGSRLGSGSTGFTGDISATFSVPGHLTSGAAEDQHELTVSDSAHGDTARFYVTRLDAEFSPRKGDPGKLRVRFHLLGWGHGKQLYLHYVNPKGSLRTTRYLGAAQGSCGHLTTKRVKLFKFVPRPGLWKLQIDTQSSYSPTTTPRAEISYRIKVTGSG